MRWGGKQLLWAILTVAVLYGCKTAPYQSQYQAVVPVLEAAPLPLRCSQGLTETRCLLLLEEDYRKVVRELKTACLALGGSTDACQTKRSNEINTLSIEPR